MRRVSRTSNFSVLLATLLMVAPMLGALAVVPPAGADVIGAYNLGQCANGGGNSTATSCVENWINGNLVPSKAHFAEGDYLTTFNRTVTNADPCTGVTGCTSVGASTFAIPKDTVTPGPAVRVPGVFTMFGATINGVSAYTKNGDSSRITISFTTVTGGVTNPVLAWGGHIATRIDWARAAPRERSMGPRTTCEASK